MSGRNIIKLLCAVSIVAGVLWFGLPGTGKSSRASLLSVKDSDHDEPGFLGNLTTGNARHSLKTPFNRGQTQMPLERTVVCNATHYCWATQLLRVQVTKKKTACMSYLN